MPTIFILLTLVFYLDKSLARKVPLLLSHRLHHISPSWFNVTASPSLPRWSAAHVDFAALSLQQRHHQQQHLYPSPAPGTTKAVLSHLHQNKTPNMCRVRERGGKSSQFMTCMSVTRGPRQCNLSLSLLGYADLGLG